MVVKRLSALEETELFPTGEVFVRTGEMDPGLAWCESAQAADPDLTLTLALCRKLNKAKETEIGQR